MIILSTSMAIGKLLTNWLPLSEENTMISTNIEQIRPHHVLSPIARMWKLLAKF